MSFFGDMDRPEIGNFFLPCVVDTLIGENQHTHNDKSKIPSQLDVFIFYAPF